MAINPGNPADHPRVSGEHFPSTVTYPYPSGSSPRERGALIPGVQGCERTRIIPA